MESEQDNHQGLLCFLALKTHKFVRLIETVAVRHPHSNQGVTANQKLSLFLSDLNSEKMLTVIKRTAQRGLQNCGIPNKIHVISKLFTALSLVGCVHI